MGRDRELVCMMIEWMGAMPSDTLEHHKTNILIAAKLVPPRAQTLKRGDP